MNTEHVQFLLQNGTISEFLNVKDVMNLRNTCQNFSEMKMNIFVEPEFHTIVKIKKIKITNDNKNKNIIKTREKCGKVYVYNNIFGNVKLKKRELLYFKLDIKDENLLNLYKSDEESHYTGLRVDDKRYVLRFKTKSKLEKIVRKMLDEFRSYFPYELYSIDECYQIMENILTEEYEEGGIDDMYTVASINDVGDVNTE